jgi:hypothetical protein
MGRGTKKRLAVSSAIFSNQRCATCRERGTPAVSGRKECTVGRK